MAGRPSSYHEAFAHQAAKLCDLGATDKEVSEFFAADRSEDDWICACFILIRQDRNGVIAHRKRQLAISRKKRMESNPSDKLLNATRTRIWAALKGRSDGRLFSRLGYTIDQLAAHLERKFAAGMSWLNYGKWHVDHIKPCATFNLADERQFMECWSLNNLQPLWARENIKKGARYGAS